MPKTQNGVNHTKSNDTLTERPKRATKKPDRYRQEECSQAVSDNDSNDIISDSDSNDSRQTLEARIWALESVIANRANMKKNHEESRTHYAGFIPIHFAICAALSLQKLENPACWRSSAKTVPVSTTDDDELLAEIRKKKHAKKSKRQRKSHDHSSADCNYDEEGTQDPQEENKQDKSEGFDICNWPRNLT